MPPNDLEAAVGPISDIVILDLTEHIAGPYATRLLADFGADVIKVERPGGDPARSLPPFKDDERHREKSGAFAFFNINKRSVVLDLATEHGRVAFAMLLDRADAVVESCAPGVLDALGLGWDFVHAQRPDLPLISITNFGQESPYRDYQGDDLVLYAFAGEMYTMGTAEREPVKMYGTAALVESGAAAATAIMAAVIASREQGVGQHVDFSIADSHIVGADRRHVGPTAFEFSGRRSLRPSRATRPILSGIYPCADGYVEMSAAGARWDRFQRMLGYPEWAMDPKWTVPGALVDPSLVEEFEGNFFPWAFERTMREIWDSAREARVLCAPLFTVAELAADAHFRDRGFWQTVDHPDLGSHEIPGRPLIMHDSPWELRRPAPRLGEHTAEVLAESPPVRAAVPTLPSPHLPLEGLRVLDFCVVWAGPFSTLLLADLGAEVIKVENPFVLQPMTRGTIARPSKELLARLAPAAGGYPNNEPGPRAWNYHPTFVSLMRNKKSVTMDIRRPEGKALLARLVAKSDVVIENNATETLEKLAITYDWLKTQNDRIIMVRMPAYGSNGPYAQARALGVHLESVAGHTLLRGYRDLDPTYNSAIFSGDYMAGAQAALAVMMAAWHRKQTGHGQLIEVGQAENAAAMLAQAYMDYALNGRESGAIGNRSVHGYAPCGVYPCRSDGGPEQALDRWIAIEVRSDEEWRTLCRVMARTDWAADPVLASEEGRRSAHDRLDREIADWTARQDDYDLFHLLQRAGVPAAPVLESSRLFDDEHVRARGLYQPQRLFDLDRDYRFPAPMFRFPETPITVRLPAAAMGEHNEYVYREVIGVSDEEWERYKAAGHISMDFDPSIR